MEGRSPVRPFGLRSASKRLAVVAAATVLVAAACEPATMPQLPLGHPVGDPVPGTVVDCSQADQRIQLSASARLDPNCTYRAGIDVIASHVMLDCHGATIDPGDERSGVGIHVHSPAASPLVDVEVRNCVTRGFTNGIRVSRDGFKDLEAGHEYDVGTEDIRLINNDVAESNGTGIFVNAFVTDVTIDRQRVHDAGGPGIYLEAGSKQNTVTDSTIIDNGYANTALPAQTMTLSGTTFAYLQTGREGIAIDGSRDNLITGNIIAHNALAGVTLYKNCGEFATEKPTQWWTRRYGASGNRIESNLIVNERNGVWVASRMSENTYFLDCSDTPYDTGPLRTNILDSATDTTIDANTFVNVTHGVRVEDDRTTLTSNRFLGDSADPNVPVSEAILVGTRSRTQVLGQPVVGTVMADNVSELVGVGAPFAWIYSPVSGLEPGVAPPIDLFLMVASIWVAS